MIKTLLKTLFSSSIFAFGLIWTISPTFAADFVSHEIKLEKHGDSFISGMILEKQKFNSVGLQIEGKVQELMVNFGKGWEAVELHDDYALGLESLVFTSPTKQIQFKASSVSKGATLKTTLFYYFEDGIGGPESEESLVTKNKIYTRAEWGADEKWRVGTSSSTPTLAQDEGKGGGGVIDACAQTDIKYRNEYNIVSTDRLNAYGQQLIWPIQKTGTIEKFAVHHSDSDIKDVTGDGQINVSDYKAIVRSIYSYHTKTRGWGDIGYNYLIDPLGNIYEGRYGGDMAIGAHSLCFNAETLGIAMIGNYETQPISKPSFEALTQLIAQKSKQYNIDLLASTEYRGKYLENIFGHKDVRSTACPGAMLYAQLEQIRKTASLISGNLSGATTISALEYNAELVGNAPSIQLKGGEIQTAILQFKNTGKTTWDSRTWLHVELNNKPFKAQIIPLIATKNFVAANLGEKTVPPGEIGTFIIRVEAGESGGDISLPVTPVVNGQYKIRLAQTIVSLSSPSRNTEGIDQNPELPTNSILEFTSVEDPLPKLPSLPKMVKKNFRVKLTHEAANSTLSANTAFTVMNESNQVLFDLSAGAKVHVTKIENGFEIKNETTIKKAEIVRLIPKENSGVTEIETMKRPPAWNQTLNDNKFRGIIEIRSIDSKVNYINELPLEDYLRGLAEVSNDAPAEKQKVIAVLARTYAQYYMDQTHRKFPGLPYDGSDDPNVFQRYLGYGVEIRSPNFVKAVEETENKVVTYEGKLVKTPYFNQSDGRTRSAQEVWGWTDTPYLKSVEDPYSKGQTLQGHGVGLSGLGATKAAENGKTFEQIIKYYYTGVEIQKLP